MSDIVTLNGYKIKDEKAVRSYDTIALMKADTKLKEGYHVKTKGYYETNDGGHGEYVIIDDDTLVEDGGSIHILNNGLRAKLIGINELTPEQFGAYGDGIHDDTVKFQSMLNMKINIKLKENAIYLMTGDLNLPEYVSIEGNNATIKYQYTGSREHQIRNSNWLTDNNYTNYLYLNNINFYVDTTSRHIKLIGLTNYDSVIIKNCNYSNNLSITQGTWFIDMYSNNRNILIDNINVITKSNTTTSLNTCLGLRQYTETGKTYNVNILNSKFVHNGEDETLWIDGWCGELSDVSLLNNKIIDESTTDVTMCWIGLGTQGGQIKEHALMNNITVDNCYFEKSKIDYACIKIGVIFSTYASLNRISNFNFNNSIIKVATGSGSIITSLDKSVTFNNVIFETKGNISFQYGYFLSGETTFNNCKFVNSGTTSETSGAFYSDNSSFNNCTISTTNGNIFNNSSSIELSNCDISGMVSLLYINGNISSDFIIKNCNISATGNLIRRFNTSSSQSIKILDCNIVCVGSVFNNWAITGTKNIQITNTNFYDDTFKIVNASDDNIYISNCTNNGLLLSGIPTNENDRGSCVIGTVFDGGAGHSVARKISAGSSTTNWELI